MHGLTLHGHRVLTDVVPFLDDVLDGIVVSSSRPILRVVGVNPRRPGAERFLTSCSWTGLCCCRCVWSCCCRVCDWLCGNKCYGLTCRLLTMCFPYNCCTQTWCSGCKNKGGWREAGLSSGSVCCQCRSWAVVRAPVNGSVLPTHGCHAVTMSICCVIDGLTSVILVSIICASTS